MYRTIRLLWCLIFIFRSYMLLRQYCSILLDPLTTIYIALFVDALNHYCVLSIINNNTKETSVIRVDLLMCH